MVKRKRNGRKGRGRRNEKTTHYLHQAFTRTLIRGAFFALFQCKREKGKETTHKRNKRAVKEERVSDGGWWFILVYFILNKTQWKNEE